jgi:sigma-E factor negative regulatory protein RseB
MTRTGLARSTCLALALTGGATAVPADSAHDWLLRINQAARTLNYDGTFVYQHNGRLETLRVVHRVDGNRTQERLVSLTGPAREIIRNDKEVLCYLPDEKSVMVEHRKAEDTGFPRLLPERLAEVEQSYTIQIGKTARISGRAAQHISIKPRDAYRYGYQFWADRDTGLLLQAELHDTDQQVIERFLFTQVSIGVPIPTKALQPETDIKDFSWHRTALAEPSGAAPAWQTQKLPPGFRLTSHRTRPGTARKTPVEHLVYSDGLATVSVFIEKFVPNETPEMKGLSHMGAVHAFGARHGDFQITAVGEVPAATVSLIGASMVAGR